MPNHVSSSVEIVGTTEDITQLKKFLNSKEGQDLKEFNFNAVITRPLTQDPNWYDWNRKNWGTKWNTYDEEDVILNKPANALNLLADKDIAYIKYRFSTAWSTIDKVLVQLSKMFPEVYIKYRYSEEGNGFAGTDTFHKGNAYKMGELDYEVDKPKRFEELYQEIYSTETPTPEELLKELKVFYAGM